MRFILKAAFWLGLIAFFVPFGGTSRETSANISLFSAFIGAQEAITDLSGFCTRAPQACDTGREFAVFAGERIGDGVAMAYGLVEGRFGAPGTPATAAPPTDVAALPAAPGATPTDPLTTGAVDPRQTAIRGPSAYQPPRRAAETDDVKAEASAPAASKAGAVADKPGALAIPTPAPRA